MENTIQSDLIRGNVNTIILKALFDGDRYGYDIIKEIEQKSSGRYKLKQPTLYSCLNRLEVQGLIRSYWGAKSSGGRRKYYTLTDLGKEVFIKNQSEWEYSRTVIDRLISDKEVDLDDPKYGNTVDNVSEDSSKIDEPEIAIEDNDENEVEVAASVNYDESAFTDTNAVIAQMFSNSESNDNSYLEKIQSDSVTGKVDSSAAASEYFNDFYSSEVDEEDEEQKLDIPHDAVSNFNNIMSDSQKSEQLSFNDNEYNEQKNEHSIVDDFLSYNSSIDRDDSQDIIKLEYQKMLGGILDDCFGGDALMQNETKPSPDATTEQQPESSAQPNYSAEHEALQKLDKLSGEVREMGDNLKIRTYRDDTSKQYSNMFYYYSNRLMLVHYAILFAIMVVEVLGSALLVFAVLKEGSKADIWVYIVAIVVALVFPTVAFIKNYTAPLKRKRVNFNLKHSLIFRSILMIQCFIIIYCLNVFFGMPLSFDISYLSSLLIPAVLCTNFPVSSLIFSALFRSKKYSVDE